MTEPAAARMTENEIRPDELMKGQAERYAADVQRLLARRDEFVAVPCPACQGHEADQAFSKYELSYLVCRACGTMYVSPRPSPAVLDMYYSTSENYAYWNQYIFPASEEARRAKIFRPRAERVAEICRRLGVRTGVLLEVGAGFGTFCQELQAQQLFQRVIALEPTPDLAATCRARGLEVIDQPIERLSREVPPLDVIVSFEVIEHLFAPRDFLARCAALLAPGGLLVLTCPNGRGFDVLTLQALSDTVDTEHLNYFHPASLAALVDACGFETLEVSTPGRLDAELVRKKALAGLLDLSGQPFLKQVLLDEWEVCGEPFQQFLATNRLSSHMWLVARRSA